MKLRHTTALWLSLILVVLPATAAFAKPVSSHHLAVTWGSSGAAVFVNGSLDVTIHESGVQTIYLLVTESRLDACGDGSLGSWNRSVDYRGPATLTSTIDRNLETIEIVGSLEAEETVTSSCTGTTEVTKSMITIDLSGSATDRPVRTRDHASGTRVISRALDFVLDLNGDSISDPGVLSKSISSS